MSSNSIETTRNEIRERCTLTQFILESRRKYPSATGDLTLLLTAIQTATKYISSKVRTAGLGQLYGEQGSTNVQGEMVKKLDVISNEAFTSALRRSLVVSAMISEEDDTITFIPESNGHYVVCFDPLDGSSNIDVCISIGTIFAIYRVDKPAKDLTKEDLLLPGTQLITAGYAMYGTATVMVLTMNEKDAPVNAFTLDPEAGEFVLSHANMKIPAHKNIYSINQGNYPRWSDDVKAYVDHLSNPPPGAESYSARYVGSMVADVHRTLVYGGIFAYPADKKEAKGKLRLLYEANPMSMIIEHAGGRAIWGKGKRVLEIVPTAIHERTPIFLGGSKSMDILEKFLK